MVDVSATAAAIAAGFQTAISTHCPDTVAIGDVVTASAAVLIAYLAQTSPAQRAVLLSDFVDTVFSGLDANNDTDIALLQ